MLELFEHSRKLFKPAPDSDNSECRNIILQINHFARGLSEKTNELQLSCKAILKKMDNNSVLFERNDIAMPLVETDPSQRPYSSTNNQRRFLVQCGPHQPILVKNPLNKGCPEGKQNRYYSSWFKEYPHLEYSLETDAAFCYICSLFPHAPEQEKSEDAWSRKGVRKWHMMKSKGIGKPGKLEKHFSSKPHTASTY